MGSCLHPRPHDDRTLNRTTVLPYRSPRSPPPNLPPQYMDVTLNTRPHFHSVRPPSTSAHYPTNHPSQSPSGSSFYDHHHRRHRTTNRSDPRTFRLRRLQQGRRSARQDAVDSHHNRHRQHRNHSLNHTKPWTSPTTDGDPRQTQDRRDLTCPHASTPPLRSTQTPFKGLGFLSQRKATGTSTRPSTQHTQTHPAAPRQRMPRPHHHTGTTPLSCRSAPHPPSLPKRLRPVARQAQSSFHLPYHGRHPRPKRQHNTADNHKRGHRRHLPEHDSVPQPTIWTSDQRTRTLVAPRP